MQINSLSVYYNDKVSTFNENAKLRDERIEIWADREDRRVFQKDRKKRKDTGQDKSNSSSFVF